LAKACARNEPDAVAQVNEILTGVDQNLVDLIDAARDDKARELVQAYARNESEAVKLIGTLFVDAAKSIDDFMADALVEEIDIIEQIDGMISSAESRRNANLRELDRRRASFGERVHQSLQEIEDAEFEEVDAGSAKTAKTKTSKAA
jgi:hypothetical protein